MSSPVLLIVAAIATLQPIAAQDRGETDAVQVTEEQRVTFGNLQVRWTGRGSNTVLLVPGLGSGTWIYDGLRDRLEAAGLRVGVIGIGGMAGDPGSPGTGVKPAIDALACLIRSQKGPVHVVAHSLGGAVALAAAEEIPANLKSLVIIDAGPRLAGETDRPAKEAEIDRAAGELFDGPSREERLSGWVAAMAGEAVAPRLLRDFRASDPGVLRTFFVEGRRLQLRLDPARIPVPVQVLVACDDERQCDEHRSDFVSRYAGAQDAEVVTVPGTGHFMMLDQPEQIGGLIEDHIRRRAQGQP
jgi:pimeloyl-ACP methyl ester carboxylesterase